MGKDSDQLRSLGTWLRRQRKAHDLTQAQLAQRVGCAVDTIKKLETDVRRPSPHLAARIATVLAVPVEEREVVLQVVRGERTADDLPIPTQPLAGSNRHQLRTPLPDFVGQQAAITMLLERIHSSIRGGAAAIVGVRGMGGIGKTELAMLVANRLIGAFPDAQVVVALRSTSAEPLPVEQALQQVIRAFTPEARLPDKLEELQRRYHSLLHGQRVLILADDTSDAEQVRALLPPRGSALLVTSRVRFTLPGMLALDLEPLGEEAAVRLLRQLCRRLRAADARTLAQACGYLPLALRVSGSLLQNNPALPVVTYLQQLTDERQCLHRLRDPDDPELDVEAALRLSYARLDAQVQQMFRQLGVLVADFTSELAQAVVEIPAPIDIEATLHELLRRNLVIYDTERSRWRLHDLLRDLARHELEVMDEAEATQWRYAWATAYEQEIGHAKAEEHTALVAHLEVGEGLPSELRVPKAQRAIGDDQEASTENEVQP